MPLKLARLQAYVTAQNANGSSLASQPLMFTAVGVQPGAPANMVVSPNGTVVFTQPTSAGVTPITEYIELAVPMLGSPPGAGNVTINGATSPLELGGLQQGMNYTLYVTAVNANGSPLAGHSQILTYVGNGYGFGDARVITIPVHLEGTTVRRSALGM
jgi:hypothetical protein